ncbi:hypothetical protein SCUCBS95973_002006 [Sporothrix curviconia]|uniref:Uncharacterized protein n=1 Tax=Sporothrix curviconia TaxID=1260050 RepID=A0ABP0B3B5_9PEZI
MDCMLDEQRARRLQVDQANREFTKGPPGDDGHNSSSDDDADNNDDTASDEPVVRIYGEADLEHPLPTLMREQSRLSRKIARLQRKIDEAIKSDEAIESDTVTDEAGIDNINVADDAAGHAGRDIGGANRRLRYEVAWVTGW